MAKKKRFEGIIPPIITPLTTPEKVDSAGLKRLITHVLDGGVHGIFPLGTTGELPSLSTAMKKKVIETTVEEVNGRVPVCVGVSDPSYTQVLKNIELCAKIGADAAVLQPPYYFPLGNDELVIYFTRVAERSALPILLYNIPSLTKTNLSHEVVARVGTNPKIIGLKDSQGDMSYLQGLLQYFRDRKDFSIFIGIETLLAEGVLFHGAGGVPGGANVAPKLFVKLYNAAKRRDFKTVDQLQSQVIKLNSIYRHGRFWSSYLKGVKSALSIMGICSDVMTETFDPFTDKEKSEIRKELEDIGIV